MLLGSVPDVGVPPIAWVPRGQAVHEGVTYGFGEDGGRRNGLAPGVAIHQRVVGVADLRQGQPVYQDAVGLAEGVAQNQPTDGPAHGQRGGDSNVEAVDLVGRGGTDPEGYDAAPDSLGQPDPFAGGKNLAVAEPPDAGATGRKDYGRCHHWSSQGAAAGLVNPDEELLLGPNRPFPDE